MPTTAPVSRLQVQEPVDRPLGANQTHTYALRLERDQYAHLTAQQLGADVELQLFDPAGNLVVRRDGLTAARGAERLHAIAAVSGEFEVRVVGLEVEPGRDDARYVLELETLRSADARDRSLAAASRAFGEGDFAQALAHWQAAEDSLEEATTRLQLALQQRRNDPDAALGQLQAADDLFRTLHADDTGVRRLHGTVLGLLSEEHLTRQNPQAALQAAEQAAEIFQAVGPKDVWVGTLIRVGQACQWLDLTERGMQALEDAVDLAQALNDPRQELLARQALAQFHYQRNALDTSRREWERVESLAKEAGDEEMVTLANRWLTRILVREDRFSEAGPRLEERLRKTRASSAHYLPLVQDAVELHLGLEAFDQAEEWIEEGLARSRERHDTQFEAVFLHLQGRLHHARGRHERNLSLQARARELYQKVGDRQGELSTQYVRAQSLYALERYGDARTTLEQLLKAAENVRVDSLSYELRASYMDARRHYWELYVDTLMRLHDASPGHKFDELALVAGETARARSLYDQLVEADLRSRSEQSSELRSRRHRIRDKLRALELDASRGTPASAGVTQSVEAQRTQLLEILDRLDRRMRSELDLPREIPELSISTLRHETLRHEGTYLVSYFFGQDRAYAWLISHDGVLLSTSLDASPSEIETMARAWVTALTETRSRSRETRRNLSLRLGKLLFDPLRQKLPSGRLVVVPDGALHAMPFAALFDPGSPPDGPGRYLVERHEVVQVPSITVLQELQSQEGETPEEPASRSVFVFADPAYPAPGSEATAPPHTPGHETLRRAVRDLGRSGLEPLPHSRKEARAIQRAAEARGLPCRLFLGHDARKSILTDGGMGPVHALHFATHGLLDPAHPELSGLVLSLEDESGRPLDGYLRLHELYDLRLDARMAVLSACDTGAGRELRGEGLINLTRGFFYSGVPRVVASLWSVEDESTAELMSRFYRFHLQKNLIPSSALNAAQRTMLQDERWNDPYHWAAFTFQGDWASGAGFGDDPIGGVALEPPPPQEPAGDSEVPFVVPVLDAGGGS